MWTEKELIKCCKESVENTIKYELGAKQYNYLIGDLRKEVFQDCRIEFDPDDIAWDEDNVIKKKADKYFSLNLIMPVNATGKLTLIKLDSGDKQTFNRTFNFHINMWLHHDEEKPEYSYEILDYSKKILLDYNEEIWKVLDNHGINALNEEAVKFDGKRSAEFFTSITRQEKNLPLPFNDFEVHDDIIMCHQDIVFALGELIAYKPHISDFTANHIYYEGRRIFRYFPSFYDKRYLSNIGRVMELLYNYWDKIGDLLSKYFTPDILESRIYFPVVVENIDVRFRENLHFEWITNFRNIDYPKLNESRKKVVHYTTVESQLTKEYFNNYSNLEELKPVQAEKEGFVDYFKRQYDLTKEGFYHALKLIEMK